MRECRAVKDRMSKWNMKKAVFGDWTVVPSKSNRRKSGRSQLCEVRMLLRRRYGLVVGGQDACALVGPGRDL